MRKRFRSLQSNNSGFTLLEVLVAMVILTIVCVPLLRSFATSAQTNAKAKIQMRSTLAAQNVMEQVKNMTVEELDDFVASNEIAGSTPSGVDSRDHWLKIDNDSLLDSDPMKADLPDGYYTEVKLEADGNTIINPSTGSGASAGYAYPNANSLNLSEFSPISVRDCAIYTMESTYDSDAYTVFKDRNDAYTAVSAIAPTYTEDDFKVGLTRLIEINTERVAGGTYTDAEGNTIDLVKVNLKITYTIPNSLHVVDSGKNQYIATDVSLFDNSSSHQPLNGIYLFYYPRYIAAASNKDLIKVSNTAGVKTNIYLVALSGAVDATTPEGINYVTNGKQKIDITDVALDAEGKGALTLRTNLLQTNAVTTLKTPYSSKDTNDYRIGFRLSYKAGGTAYPNVDWTTDPENYSGNANAAIVGLNIGNVDGKSIIKGNTRVRIYRVTVDVYDSNDNRISTMEGTKLRQDM